MGHSCTMPSRPGLAHFSSFVYVGYMSELPGITSNGELIQVGRACDEVRSTWKHATQLKPPTLQGGCKIIFCTLAGGGLQSEHAHTQTCARTRTHIDTHKNLQANTHVQNLFWPLSASFRRLSPSAGHAMPAALCKLGFAEKVKCSTFCALCNGLAPVLDRHLVVHRVGAAHLCMCVTGGLGGDRAAEAVSRLVSIAQGRVTSQTCCLEVGVPGPASSV